jgi:streptomycin 6-kinase
VRALPQVPTLSAYAARQLATPPPVGVLPRRFVEQGRRLAAELASDPEVDAWLLHTDLHYENVLRGEREPWLAIDPKPTAGDRAFEIAPALWNRADELGTGSSVRWNLRRRLAIVCQHGEIDEARAKAWTIVREVDNASDPAEGPGRSGLAVAIIKAMND